MLILSKQNITLDVVVIGRNEGNLLKSTLDSAIKAGNYFQECGYCYPKIIYIDGKSSDKSVKIAKDLGIKVSIVSGMPNPSKGRHLGFTMGKSKYVFFLDGDTIVDKKWLVRAVEYLEKNIKIAGVAGILDWEEWKDGRIIQQKKNYWNTHYNGQNIIDGVGGNFLYRRDVLEYVGDFNPNLPVHEEFELRLRIAQAGYNLNRILASMATHRDVKNDSIIAFFRKNIFTKNILVSGIITRQAPKNRPVLLLLFYKYWLYLFQLIAILCILVFIFFYFYNFSKIWIVYTTVIIIFLFIAHYFYKGKNLRRAMISMITMNFFCIGWIIGLLTNRPKIRKLSIKKCIIINSKDK